jgi:hypothetical protein
MKRVLSLMLVAGVAFSLGHFLRGPVPLAGAMGGVSLPLSGDVNGDGKLNIADGIYIINHQFMGGPAPVPIVCPPTGLPATGQTKCYSNEAEVPCDSLDYPGQDGAYQAGCPTEGRFVDHGDGTVTDTCTGLMWQKDTVDVNGNGTIGEEDRLDWRAALNYCDSLSLAGDDDWRLPNVRELHSIVDYDRYDPAIDPVFGALSSAYWSSTSLLDDPHYARTVVFAGGYVYDELKGNGGYIRAVRNAP